MAFSVVEWFVLVFAVLVIIKLIFISFAPKSWFSLAKKLYSSPVLLVLVELILAAVLFWYLLMELTIVQIMAAVILGALLTGMSFAVYGKETLAWATKLFKTNMLKKAWLPILIWLVLSIWALVALF